LGIFGREKEAQIVFHDDFQLHASWAITDRKIADRISVDQ